MRISIPLAMAVSLMTSANVVNSATFNMQKNDQNFSIDGNNGSIQGQQLYLWSSSTKNANQNWVQLNRGDGYYSYKKEGTNLCWDGGSNGARKQAITLERCDEEDENQHWKKIKVISGTEIYRFEKRNAPGWSIDGAGGAKNRQSVYLWNSSDTNINQQWELTRTDNWTQKSGELSVAKVFDDGSSHANYPATNAIDDSSAWASRWAASGSPVNLTLELEEVGQVEELAIAWGRGDSRIYTFEVYARPGTSGSWTKVFDSVSGGGTAGLEVFDLDDIDARQVRIKTFENTSGSDWTNILEVKLYGSGTDASDTPTPTPTPNPSEENKSEIPELITDSELWDLEGDEPHPLVDPYTLVFLPLEAQYTSPNGSGWRQEYKIASDQRVGMSETYEDLQATAKIDMSDGGKTIIAQHHAGDTGTIMKLYVADSSESGFYDSVPANGIFDVYVRMLNTSGVEEKMPLGTIKSGDTFSFRVINNYGVVSVSAFGETMEIEVEDDSASYLKFGNYLQSQYPDGNIKCGEKGNTDSFSECYKDIGITEAKVTMTDVSYKRFEGSVTPAPSPTPDASPTPVVQPGNAEYPSDLMRNFNQWKITFPDGEEDKTLYQESNEYFYVNEEGNGIVFFAPVRSDNGTTPNSSYIRSELRERTEDGSADIYWTTDGKHVVYAKQAITHLPLVKNHLVATQIHGNKEAGIDDSLVLRLEGSHLFLSFNGGKLRDNVTIKTDYELGAVHEVMFEVIDGKHYVYYSEDGKLAQAYANGDADQYLVKDGSNDYLMNLSYGESYFKIGNYTQSNPEKEGSSTDDPSNYGEVVVYDFWVDHLD